MNVPVAFFGAAPGSFELLLVFTVALILFGPRQLPKLARMIGKTLEQLRSLSMDFRDQVMNIKDELYTDERAKSENAASTGDKMHPAGKQRTALLTPDSDADGEDKDRKNDLAG